MICLRHTQIYMGGGVHWTDGYVCGCTLLSNLVLHLLKAIVNACLWALLEEREIKIVMTTTVNMMDI